MLYGYPVSGNNIILTGRNAAKIGYSLVNLADPDEVHSDIPHLGVAGVIRGLQRKVIELDILRGKLSEYYHFLINLIQKPAVPGLLHIPLESQPLAPPKAVWLGRIRAKPDIAPAARDPLEQTPRVEKWETAEEYQHYPGIFPGHKMPVIQAVNHLKSDAEFVDIPSEPSKERKGKKNVITLDAIRSARKWGYQLFPVLKFTYNLVEQRVGYAVLLPQAKDLLDRSLQGSMAPLFRRKICAIERDRIVTETPANCLLGFPKLRIKP
ncbi:uncharacterized protein KD926_005342 [Aspergillus affinis]|uniref:uncharacterized protein n=1 Tax=Aspergillus affinis TaxID=1070780 RepID=UPI0022FE7AC3|nr:uncharacterized protein KD926_005342 [Aspergillus affinis]KAI9034822.1 hypothetical protein KD926_005342 [Aspergillus affinis]